MKTIYFVLGLLLLSSRMVIDAQPGHDRAFWQSIANAHYAVPEHESPDALAVELSTLLASTDPELRDDLAYSILTNWIYRASLLKKSTLISLTDVWRTNLKDGLGETGTNSVLKRSFSALCLSSMANREAKAPFMGAERYHQLVAEAISYLQTERDLRGYDPKLHWIHATAHTADLLAALADSPQLTEPESMGILSAIAARLTTVSEVYTQGEQDRLAAAVLAALRSSVFDPMKFGPWLTAVQNEDRDVWTKITPESINRYQNHNYLLQALFVRLALEADSPHMAEFKKNLLTVLKARLN
jgi:hypothetical protein